MDDPTRSPGHRLRAELPGLEGLGTRVELREDEPMSRHTTLRLGGPADLWCRPADRDALAAVLAQAAGAGVPITFVGAGTNLLVRDGGIRGLVINLGRMNEVARPDPEGRPGRVEVDAGATTGRLLARARAWALGGVEFLAGVPGSVGGGLVMNAGTVLGEFKDVVVSVASLDLTGRPCVRDHDACGFAYRRSALPANEIVVGAEIELTPREPRAIDSDIEGLRARRRQREPSGVANCGSTFKNPPGDHAGRLIELAGLKGTRRGRSCVSPIHANWLVVEGERAATGGTDSADYLELMAHVRDEVERRFGIALEPELRVIGDDRPSPDPSRVL